MHSVRMRVMSLRALAILALLFLMASIGIAQGSAQAAARVGASDRGCFKDLRTFIRAPMPTPTVLTRRAVAQKIFDATITLDPVQATTRPAVSPRTVWATLEPQNPGGSQQLVLAYYSASLPASLEANGSLQPDFQHVLAWVVYGKDLPFSLEGASIPPRPGQAQPGPFNCTFVGQGLTAWNASTGEKITAAGAAPNSDRTLQLKVTPWTPKSASSPPIS
jgi:hypothetical protein